jgi:hypothetical protein
MAVALEVVAEHRRCRAQADLEEERKHAAAAAGTPDTKQRPKKRPLTER